MQIMGISALYHDSAAALVQDGHVVAAAQEERFTRKKHDPAIPVNAVQYCLAEGGIQLSDLDYLVFYENSLIKMDRIIQTYLSVAPKGFSSFRLAMPEWCKWKFSPKHLLQRTLARFDSGFDWDKRYISVGHHMSHAASAFYPSPFKDALILTMDGVGEWTTTSAFLGHDAAIEVIKEIPFPHSMGLLYSAFTYYLGFKVNSGEYKVMGLAPYGKPRYTQTIFDNLIDIKPDGSFMLNLRFFDYCGGLKMTNRRFDRLFGGRRREPDEPIEQRHMDLAASIQFVLEHIVVLLTKSLVNETGVRNVCLAGGVALNCVANTKLLRSGCVDKLWIQPAAGDAGGALGAAFAAYYRRDASARRAYSSSDNMEGAFLGPEFSQEQIEANLNSLGARFRVLPEEELLESCVESLCDGKALGWFQGRMEFGPRALGARSILADPRFPEMQSILNLKVKKRESFRPFAPSVLHEDAAEWFNLNCVSPYMLLVAEVAEQHRHVTKPDQDLTGLAWLRLPRSDIPAVTHVDFSARVQTVHSDTNPGYHRLLERFKRRTGCPVLVNTSFNVRGEPIVCTPEDAYRCFMNTEIDLLAIGNCLLYKQQQEVPQEPSPRFEPD